MYLPQVQRRYLFDRFSGVELFWSNLDCLRVSVTYGHKIMITMSRMDCLTTDVVGLKKLIMRYEAVNLLLFMLTSNDEHIEYTIREIVSAISERQAGIRGETKKAKLLAQMTMVASQRLKYKAILTLLFLHLLILVLCNRMGQVQMPSEQCYTEAAASRPSNRPSESGLQHA